MAKSDRKKNIERGKIDTTNTLTYLGWYRHLNNNKKMAGNVVTGIVTCIHNELDVYLMDTTQSYSAEFASATKRCTSPLKIV